MGKVMDAINDLLFPPAVIDNHAAVGERVKDDGFPFEVNERAYYLNRVDSRLQAAHRAKRNRNSRQVDPSGGYYPEPFYQDQIEVFRESLENPSQSLREGSL